MATSKVILEVVGEALAITLTTTIMSTIIATRILILTLMVIMAMIDIAMILPIPKISTLKGAVITVVTMAKADIEALVVVVVMGKVKVVGQLMTRKGYTGVIKQLLNMKVRILRVTVTNQLVAGKVG